MQEILASSGEAIIMGRLQWISVIRRQSTHSLPSIKTMSARNTLACKLKIGLKSHPGLHQLSVPYETSYAVRDDVAIEVSIPSPVSVSSACGDHPVCFAGQESSKVSLNASARG